MSLAVYESKNKFNEKVNICQVYRYMSALSTLNKHDALIISIVESGSKFC